MERWRFVSRAPEQTRALGCALGRSIGADGVAIALVGALGAGKTMFVKGLAEGLGVEPRAVSSPTFVIAQQYAVPEGPTLLHHVDLYRLEHEQELETIGFDDMLAPGGVLAVEWADRFPGVLGPLGLRVELIDPNGGGLADQKTGGERGAAGGSNTREGWVEASGDAARRILADWSERIERTPGVAELDDGAGGVGWGVEGEAGPGGSAAAGRVKAMRLAIGWGIALAALQGAQLVPAADPRAPCREVVSLESDALGSLRIACRADGPHDAAAPPIEDRELAGLARLLHGGRLELAKASAAQLEALPGIGPARAAAIVAERERRPFASLDEIERVHGIGPRLSARLARWLAPAHPKEPTR